MATELHSAIFALAEKHGINSETLSAVEVVHRLEQLLDLSKNGDALAGFDRFIERRWATGLSMQLRSDLQACWGAARSYIPAKENVTAAAHSIARHIAEHGASSFPEHELRLETLLRYYRLFPVDGDPE